ncbi:flagellar motor switch protein FliN [Aliirhizobium terrae]|uniref:flagellar motor switch protein FliN n=1 Tax=Terrirhizobium terrae TaxID=2926709 RepID=UPI00257709C3|nr:flagellar motor switch protein FliN [Rhizobium sp. CC-CFT758]WJH38978.1 flagellar motor switch protein FliN [Rhizobium sp. CC-CFT758]
MATKKTPLTDDDSLMPLGDNADLDQAIDDLRGVLKADATTETDFGAEFAAPAGADFGGGDFGMPGEGAAAFGGGDFGASSDFGGSSDFGATDDFGGSDFAGGGEFKEPGSALTANLDLIMDIPIDVEIVLGSSRMQVSGLMSLEEGATIALDKRIGEPVEIMVNGRRIGKGEITVLENDDTRFGVKLTEVLSAKRT